MVINEAGVGFATGLSGRRTPSLQGQNVTNLQRQPVLLGPGICEGPTPAALVLLQRHPLAVDPYHWTLAVVSR